MIVAYKGFAPDWKGRSNFQYALGEAYEHEGRVGVCEGGFHASEYPLDVLNYRAPAGTRFAVVEQWGRLSRHDRSNTPRYLVPDSTAASSRIRIKEELDLGGLIKAAVDYTFAQPMSSAARALTSPTNERCAVSATGCGRAGSASGDWGKGGGDGGAAGATAIRGAASATGDWGAALATGDRGTGNCTGDWGAALAIGDGGTAAASGDRGGAATSGAQGAASATGDWGIAFAGGAQGAAAATGYKAAASVTGDGACATATGAQGAALAVGDGVAASSTGYLGAAIATGQCGTACAAGEHGAAIATGPRSAASASGRGGSALASGRLGRAMAGAGCALFLVERDDNGNILAVFAGIAGRDGIKPQTWYELVDGRPTEAPE